MVDWATWRSRGNRRDTIYHKDDDDEAFEGVLDEGLHEFPVDLLTYCWMPNHWHMVLKRREYGAMGRLLCWVMITHTSRHHAHYRSAGDDHLYQGRYQSFPIQSDEHFFVVVRYVERNASAAGFVQQAEDWRFGGLFNWLGGPSAITLAEWPFGRLPNWVQRVNRMMCKEQEEQSTRCIAGGQPFGDAGWVESTARKYDLESTLRKRCRPRKLTHTSN